jgi:two-component system, OmpR family, response regulator
MLTNVRHLFRPSVPESLGPFGTAFAQNLIAGQEDCAIAHPFEAIQGRTMVTAAKQGLRVLVVDDNRDAANSLAALLNLWGYDCRVSYDGDTALHTARKYRPDCLLLDINMPGMDGCTVARRLRRESNLAQVKLVALTAYSDENHARRIREAGFDHHIVKPADIEELQRLLKMMEQVLRLTSQTEELARQNVALAAETRDLLHGVKEQIGEVKDKLEDVTHEVRELKQELRELKEYPPTEQS